jgi:DNA topoisomerase-1
MGGENQMRTLIITEKPKVSQRIASALSSDSKKKSGKGASFFEIRQNGNVVIVASAAGHLYSLAQKSSSREYPTFDIQWVPLHLIDEKKAYVKKYIETLASVSKEVDVFYIATDYDIEGEVLGYNALRFACGRELGEGKEGGESRVYRMKFSTLTKGDLQEAFRNPSEVDLPLAEAGEARHILDWYWGINASRALTQAARRTRGVYSTISAGRVQTPALSLLVDREIALREFKPQTYWEVTADLKKGETVLRARHEEREIFDRSRVEGLLALPVSDGARISRIQKETLRKFAPFPFDLGSLQSEAYRLYRLSPKRTQQLAQTLYEGGYISYPRTSSQKLPPKVGYRRILERLSHSTRFREMATALLGRERIRPREGPGFDPAHPAIFPTGNLPKSLGPLEQKIYDLIVHRFFATFGDPLLREKTDVTCRISDEPFGLEAVRTLDPGWTRFYPYFTPKEKLLPPLGEGEKLPIQEIRAEEKETQPPKRYNPSTLLKELERRQLGTKATRAEIIETLYRREYVQGNPMEVTELGFSVVEALREYAPPLLSEDLTRRFEEKLKRIQEGKETKERVLEEARRELIRILEEFKEKEELIGKRLGEASLQTERRKNAVGECPRCGKTLRIIRSRKSGKIFVGCSGYPECSRSYPLPQKIGIRPTQKKCNHCSLPMVSVPLGRRRVLSCLDMECRSKERIRSKTAPPR